MVRSFPIGEILHNRDATGRIAKWAVELGSFELTFQPRTAIKSQALVDFIAKWTEVQTPAITEKLEYCVTPLVLILANCALSMIKIDLEPLHTLICAIECIWTKLL